MRPGAPDATVDAPAHGTDVRPTASVVVARGLGWGAGLGYVAGFLLPAVTALAMDGFSGTVASALLLGVLTGPFGLVIGAVVGALVGSCCVPLVGTRRAGASARALAAVLGPAFVVGIDLLLFRPRFEIGLNETRDHMIEEILIFVAVPGAFALLAGSTLGDRLVRPIRGANPPPDGSPLGA